MSQSENVQVTQKQIGLFTSSKQPEIHKLKYDPETKVNYDPITGEIIDIRTGIPTGEIFKPEESELEIQLIKDLIISTEYDVSGESREISLKMNYDNDGVLISDRWIIELLVDGKTIHETRSYNDFPHSEEMQDAIKKNLVEKITLTDAQASEVVYCLVELSKTRHDEIYCLNPQIVREKQTIAEDILVSTNFDGHSYSLRTTPTRDGWRTTLLMDDVELDILEHKSPIYVSEKKRDSAFAKRIMVELGKTSKDKYLKPIYDIIKSANERQEEIDNIATSYKIALLQEAAQARRESEERAAKDRVEREEKAKREKSEANKAKNDHTIRKIQLYEKLCNKNGDVTPQEIISARDELKQIMMSEFWSIEGFNEKTGKPGHLALQKLPIADYIQKAFNIVRFGGRNWWYDWERAFYTYDSEDVLINQEVARIMEDVGKPAYRYNGNSIADKSQIIDHASLKNVHVDTPFNKCKNVINARNGILKLDYEKKTVKLVGKKPDYMFSYCIDTIYDPNADSSVIDKELERILGPVQKELIYQIAAIAIRDTDPDLAPSKIAYIFQGKPNTGKNTVQNLLLKFFGKRVVSHIPLHEIIENKFVKPLLEGKLLNLDDELPLALEKNESREIKSLTGGKTHTLEPKNVKPYEGIITALMIFAGNQFPKCSITKAEAAFWDRWDVLKFEHQFKVDEKFEADMFTGANLSGFFNKVIEKLFEIHDNGIKRNIPKEEIYSEWMTGSSSVYRFVSECMEDSGEFQMRYQKEILFAQYDYYCSTKGIPKEDRCPTLASFATELYEKCGVQNIHIGSGKSGGERSYVFGMYRKLKPNIIQAPDLFDDELYENAPDVDPEAHKR